MTDVAKLDLRQQLAMVMTNLELIGDLVDDGQIESALELYGRNQVLSRKVGIMLSLYPYETHFSLKVGGTV